MVFLCRDSTKLKQVWLCAHCSIGSAKESGTARGSVKLRHRLDYISGKASKGTIVKIITFYKVIFYGRIYDDLSKRKVW